MSQCCSDNLSLINIQGPPGVGVSSITSTPVAGGQNLTITFTNLSTQGPFFITNGVNGTNGQSIHSSSFTISDTAPTNVPNKPGAIDTYTIWGNALQTINLGTFKVYNGDDNTTSDSAANVGGFRKVYVNGSVFPFNFRTLQSSNSSLNLTENSDNIDLILNTGSWLEIQAQGTPITGTNSVYLPSGAITALSNLGGTQTVGFKRDISTNKVVMKGACQMTVTGTIGGTPTAPVNGQWFTICTLPSLYSPGAGVQCMTTAQLYNTTTAHSSQVLLNITAGAIAMYIDVRYNYIDSNTRISFENTMFSTNNA